MYLQNWVYLSIMIVLKNPPDPKSKDWLCFAIYILIYMYNKLDPLWATV